MSWVNQYKIGDEVIITRPDSDMYDQQGVVIVVDDMAHGMLVRLTRSNGESISRVFYKETDIRPCGIPRKRPVSPVFYSIKETY